MDHLWVTFNNPDCLCSLKIELAVVVDVGKHFVAATYYLEGDSALSLSCYERLQAVCDACQLDMMRIPNLHAVSQDVSASIPEVTKEGATEYGYSCV